MPTDALIFVPLTDPHARHWVAVCFSHCLRHGYVPKAVVRRWDDVWQLILDGVDAVVVVGVRDHLDPRRTPRVEVIAEQIEPGATPELERPRRIGEARR